MRCDAAISIPDAIINTSLHEVNESTFHFICWKSVCKNTNKNECHVKILRIFFVQLHGKVILSNRILPNENKLSVKFYILFVQHSIKDFGMDQ